MTALRAETPAPVPTLRFDSDDHPGAQAIALLACSLPYDVRMPDGLEPEQFRARMQAWRVDSLLVTAGFMCTLHLTRTPERIRADGRDGLCLMLVREGDWRGDFDGLDVTIPRGHICVIDFSRPFDTFSPDSQFIMLSLPRPTLELSEEGAADRHGRVLDGLSGRLLADHFRALARLLPETQPEDLPTVAEATLAMVRSCLAHAPQRKQPRPAQSLPQRVRAYVDAHLTDLDLSPERVAQALYVTRSTLYRAFPTAGVAAYIQGRRLEAIRALLDNPAETCSLVALAASFGFASHAHFTTAFRRRFGYPPSQARRGAPASPEDEANTVHAFQNWLRSLEAYAYAARSSEETDAS